MGYTLESVFNHFITPRKSAGFSRGLLVFIRGHTWSRIKIMSYLTQREMTNIDSGGPLFEWSFTHVSFPVACSLKGNVGIGIRSLLRKNKYNVYLVDEFRTSCKCSNCAPSTSVALNLHPCKFSVDIHLFKIRYLNVGPAFVG